MSDRLNKSMEKLDIGGSSEPDVSFFNRNPSNSSVSRATTIKASSVPVPKTDLEIYYDMNGFKYMYIFNHYQYEKRRTGKTPSIRNGTGQDVRRLTETFGKLGFRVEDFPDFKYKNIMEVIQHIIISDHSETSCIAIVILTHGCDGGFVEAADKEYPLSDIYNKFINSNNERLISVPKLFFIQACRGDDVDSGKIMTDGDSENDVSILLPSHINFLTMYSTVPGYVSWRDSSGSWLIQEFCNCLDEYSDKHHLLEIITFSNLKVARERASNTPADKRYHGKKQMPETQFTLAKLLKFR